MKIEAYLLEAIRAACEAGRAILEVYRTDFAVDHKADRSPLTDADRRAHTIIVSRLKRFEIPILSEEGKDVPFGKREKWPRLWIIDPLDGTKEFVNRNGEFTVNIALVEAGRPLLGVVLAPEKNVLYFGAKRSGAFKITVSKAESLLRDGPKDSGDDALWERLVDAAEKLPLQGAKPQQYTIVGSRSHATAELDAFVAQKRVEFGSVNFVSAGSALKICLVAEGVADLYPRLSPTMEWDTAAGQAVAEAAGAKLVIHDTQTPLTYNRENLVNPWFVVTAAGPS